MKFIEKIKNDRIEIYLLLFCMYALGVLADGFGFFNWIIKLSGILLQIAAMVFIIINFTKLFDSGLLPSRKSIIINLITVLIGIVLIIICWKLKMTTFLITAGILLLYNFILLVISMYRMSRVYMELIDDEKKQNSINDPKAKIVDAFEYFKEMM